MKLIVGLGNPGRQYERTRHNVGFLVLDRLGARLGADWRDKFAARFAKVELPRSGPGSGSARSSDGPGAGAAGGTGETLVLLQPMTFMNLSGRSVQEATAFFKIAPADVLVVGDDINLDLAVLRMRPAGSAGGHNGLKDVLRVLGTTEVPRLRIGVGRFAGRDSTGFVLGEFKPAEWKSLEPALDAAADAVGFWALNGSAAAATRFNGPAGRPEVDGNAASV